MVYPSNSLSSYFIFPSWEQLIYLYYPPLLSLSLNFVEPRDCTVCFSNSIRREGSRAEVMGSREGVRRSSQCHIKGHTDPALLGNGDPGACLNKGQQQLGAAVTLCPLLGLAHLPETSSCRGGTSQASAWPYQCKPAPGISKEPRLCFPQLPAFHTPLSEFVGCFILSISH